MSTPYDTIKTAVLGNPIDPNKQPSRTGVVRAFSEMQQQLEGAQAGALVFGLKSEMTATVVVPSANIMAWVMGDPVAANNGIHRNTGTAGAAVWTRIADIPQFLITGINVGAGTANAIQVTTDLPVPTQDGRCLVVIPIVATNTISPPTVSINGGVALPILSSSGANVGIGGLIDGMYVCGFISDNKFRLISDQANAALVAAAEAAAAAALAAANAGFVFDNEADFVAASIPVILNFVQTAGYFTPGDGGAHIKIRISTPSPVEAWHKQSFDGAWWQIAPTQRLTVEAFGAQNKTLAQLVAMAGVGVTAWAAANTIAVQNAVDFRNAFGGGNLYAEGQFYSLSGNGVEILDGVHIRGAGNDEWEPVYNNAKKWAGTTWLLVGTGTKHLQFPGITSGEHGGGWRADPDVPGTYYKKWSAYNTDGTGTTAATLKSFSAGFWSDEACNNGLYDCRIVPYNGTNGVEGYDTGNSLGADWSFGWVVINGDELRRENIQTVGYFREMGYIAATTLSVNSRMEKCRFIDLTSQGRAASGFFAPDRWATVGANGADYFDIEPTNEQYFNPAGGTPFRMSDNVSRTYASTSIVGGNLRFNGVSPAPGSAFHVRHAGRGWAGTVVRNMRNYTLFHHSGNAVETYGLQKASAHQVSGFPMRGIVFSEKNKVHCSGRTGENALFQYWDAQDPHFTGVMQVEGGKWVFASDVSTAVGYCIAPVGETRNIRFTDSEGFDDLRTAGYLDQTYFPRTGFDPALQDTPRNVLTGDRDMKSLRTGKKLRLFDDQHVLFMDCREITLATAGFGFVTVTSQTCIFRYYQIGKIVFFKLVLVWSGLDTADTSSISIRVPVDTAATALFTGTINDRLSTGINLAGTDNPYFDLATTNYLGFSVGNTTRLLYTNLAAAGELHAFGSYIVD